MTGEDNNFIFRIIDEINEKNNQIFLLRDQLEDIKRRVEELEEARKQDAIDYTAAFNELTNFISNIKMCGSCEFWKCLYEVGANGFSVKVFCGNSKSSFYNKEVKRNDYCEDWDLLLDCSLPIRG